MTHSTISNEDIFKYLQNNIPAASQVTLKEAINNHLKSTLKDRRNKKIYARFFIKRWAKKKIDEIKPIEVQKLQRQLIEILKKKPATVNRYICFLRTVLNDAIRNGKLRANPVSSVKFLKEANEREDWLDIKDEKKLKKFLNKEDYTIVRLAILTGMRRGEIFSMKWEDINLKTKHIIIPIAKSGKREVVHLNTEACSIMKRRHKQKNESQYVFPSTKNLAKHRDAQNFHRRKFLPALKLAGLLGKDMCFHSLRHSHASRLAEREVPIQTISQSLRHDDLRMSRRYIHLQENSLRRALEKLI